MNNLQKSNISNILNQTIQKGEVGSGRKIGTTSSGKDIYDNFLHPAHKYFTKEDHADAVNAHKNLKTDYLKENPNRISLYHQDSNKHLQHDLLVHFVSSKSINENPHDVNKHLQPQDDKQKLVDVKDESHKLKLKSDDDMDESQDSSNDDDSDNDDVEKGGEGSHGGIVIGHTTSQKPIYQSNHESYQNFTKQDHRDAAEVHENHRQKFSNESLQHSKEILDLPHNELFTDKHEHLSNIETMKHELSKKHEAQKYHHLSQAIN